MEDRERLSLTAWLALYALGDSCLSSAWRIEHGDFEQTRQGMEVPAGNYAHLSSVTQKINKNITGGKEK